MTTATTATTAPLVRLVDAGKRYGSIIALQGVSLEVGGGEVTCVLGDNGAGKSTLIKIIAGLHKHDEGSYEVDGTPVHFDSPREAMDHGIATVYQDLAVVPLMPVWRNFFLGSEVRRGWGPVSRMDIGLMKQTAKKELYEMGIDLRDVEQPIGTLSGGERQCVAISRAVYFGAKVLILDEPTAALGVAQTEQVLRLVRQLADNGLAVVLISHNLNDVFQVADRISVLYLGRMAAQVKASDVRRNEVVEMITSGRAERSGAGDEVTA